MKGIGVVLGIVVMGCARVFAEGDVEALVSGLEGVVEAEVCVYGLRDDGGRKMDCLEVFEGREGGVMGVYHALKNGVFSVHLGKSDDLVEWEHVVALDAHGSQATMWVCEGGGYLLAYEKDAPDSCWVRLRYYEGLAGLSSGKFLREFDVPRTLAPTAEGTPSIEYVRMRDGKLEGSEIGLRFHYFRDVRVDQLARGTLRDFGKWEAEVSEAVNAELRGNGWKGNLGDRSGFDWKGKRYYLQEVQGRRGDWGSWRVLLCDAAGMPLEELEMRTGSGSRAFCNPGVRWIGGRLVVTMFIPGEGSAGGESGEMLFVVPGK